jgi:hypothetical protein
MLARGVLDFQYEADSSRQGLTSLAGLPVYLDFVKAIGLGAAIRRRVRVAGSQGWLDIQMVLAVVFPNLAGGDCVADIERLERDGGSAGDREGFAVAGRAPRDEGPVAARAGARDALAFGDIGLVGALP